MKKWIIVLLSLTLLLTACGGGRWDYRSATLIVRNYSAFDVVYLYVSPSASGEWGPDRLGNYIIRPGYSYRMTGIPCNAHYDFLAETWEHILLDVQWGRFMECGYTFVWTLY